MRLCVVVYEFPTFATHMAGCAAEEAAASPADPGVWGCDADDEEGGTAAVAAAEATAVEDCLSSMLFSAFSESISFSSASIFWICALYCSVKNTHARTHYIHIFHGYTNTRTHQSGACKTHGTQMSEFNTYCKYDWRSQGHYILQASVLI